MRFSRASWTLSFSGSSELAVRPTSKASPLGSYQATLTL